MKSKSNEPSSQIWNWDQKNLSEKCDMSIFKKYSKMINDEKIWDYTIMDIESYPAKPETVSRSQYNKIVDDKHRAERQAKDAEDTINSVTEGNIDMQRALIQIDPHNIRYIRNPYVDIQLEAVMADSTCFHKIKNPAQEVIDMHKFVK